jgi:translocation and assembly module TamB
MHVDDVHGTIRMANDVVTVGADSVPIVGDAHGPISLRGTINVGDWREPSFDLYAYGNHALVMDNRFGKLSADLGLAMKGPSKSPYISGQVTLTGGVIVAPEPTGRHVISAGDPALFNVIDTSLATEREIFPVKSALLAHMRMEVTLEVQRDTWVRNHEANVEIYTDYPLRVDVEGETLDLTGVLATDRGDYTFLGKRFAITRGSAMFIGAREINPTLQITGDYEVREGAGAATDVKVVIGGTLRRPRLSLESDAQPPRSQAELLSLLAFGQASTSLGSGQQTSSLTPTYLLSQGAQFASRQLAAVALNEALNQAETTFGKALATDYFNITTADVPTELFTSNALNFVSTTRFEGGKYLNARTFLVGQMVGLDVPGARVQYRASEGWRYEASIEKRFLLKEPTLSAQTFNRRQAYGAFVIRQWKF